jgi:hypothetical protein
MPYPYFWSSSPSPPSNQVTGPFPSPHSLSTIPFPQLIQGSIGPGKVGEKQDFSNGSEWQSLLLNVEEIQPQFPSPKICVA